MRECGMLLPIASLPSKHFLLLQEILILSIWSSWSRKVFLQKMNVKRQILVMMTGILLTIKYTKHGLRY